MEVHDAALPTVTMDCAMCTKHNVSCAGTGEVLEHFNREED